MFATEKYQEFIYGKVFWREGFSGFCGNFSQKSCFFTGNFEFELVF